MNNLSKKNILFTAIIIIIVVYSCAIMRTPEGGPKDYTPPKMISSEPAPNAVNFNKKRVIIGFDEFIQLKDVQKFFLVSPPLKKRIIPQLRGNNKEILVELPDSLVPNTTFTLNFGNSIVDLHEGNPIPNFSFAFSTGEQIDSLSLIGKIVDAYTHLPDKDGIMLMLYPVFNDSIPRKTMPSYIAKSDVKGWFKIPHVPADSFMVFALKDLNMNYKFDQPGEIIAFSDTMVHFDQSFYQPEDTTFNNVVYSDSLKIDSINFFAGRKPKIELYFFQEDYKKQKFLEYSRTQPNQFNLYFELPVTDSMKIELLNPEYTGKMWYAKDDLFLNDTLQYWITDTLLSNKDTIPVKISYTAPDSLDRPYTVNDTIRLVFKKPATKSKRASLTKELKKFSISYSASRKTDVDLNDKLFFESSVPLEKIDESKILLSMKEDTVYIPLNYKITKDSIYLRRYNISFPLEPNREYKLIFDTLAFTSIYGYNNDSTGFRLKTRNDDYYGKILLNLVNTSGPMIVQLLNEKDQLISEKNVNSDGQIIFDYLYPAKYRFKVIYDRNNNKKWDTGNWGLRLQPEKVEILKETLSVRSNWELEYRWELKGD